MGSRARQLQPVGAHLQALQPVGGDGAPVADMLVDEFSMAGANLLLPKAADAVASLTMTTIAMPDAMPLAMAQHFQLNASSERTTGCYPGKVDQRRMARSIA